MRQEKKAFTLIELLIVVAIIAILAAIAVPNFLEAQVRAKVSRVKADERSLTNAIEMYRVDWNIYPQGDPNSIWSTWPDYGNNIGYPPEVGAVDVSAGLHRQHSEGSIWRRLQPHVGITRISKRRTTRTDKWYFYEAYWHGSEYWMEGISAPSSEPFGDMPNGSIMHVWQLDSDGPSQTWYYPNRADSTFLMPDGTTGMDRSRTALRTRPTAPRVSASSAAGGHDFSLNSV